MIFLFIPFFFLTFFIGYRIGNRQALRNLSLLMDELAELQEHFSEVKELGFDELGRVLEMELEPAINDLKQMIADMDLPSDDDNAQPQTSDTESRDQ